MRFVVFKQKVKAVASLLGIVVLALALGIGATSAILHLGWLDITQPSVMASESAEQPQVEASLPAANMTVSQPRGIRGYVIVR